MFPLKEPVSFSQKLEDHNSLLKKKSISCAALFHRYFGARNGKVNRDTKFIRIHRNARSQHALDGQSL